MVGSDRRRVAWPQHCATPVGGASRLAGEVRCRASCRNDFKTTGGVRVKPWLVESFWDVFKEKMLLVCGETKSAFLVVWGDYQLWAPGFNDGQATSAAAR